MTASIPTAFDPSCERRPDEIPEYVEAAEELGITADEYVRTEEGTYKGT